MPGTLLCRCWAAGRCGDRDQGDQRPHRLPADLGREPVAGWLREGGCGCKRVVAGWELSAQSVNLRVSWRG
jgi:hypothetical protein